MGVKIQNYKKNCEGSSVILGIRNDVGRATYFLLYIAVYLHSRCSLMEPRLTSSLICPPSRLVLTFFSSNIILLYDDQYIYIVMV